MPKVPALRVSHVKRYVHCTMYNVQYTLYIVHVRVQQLPLRNPHNPFASVYFLGPLSGFELSYHHISPQMRSEISPLGMKRANARGRIGGNWSISATPPNLSQRLQSPTDQIIFHLKKFTIVESLHIDWLLQMRNNWDFDTGLGKLAYFVFFLNFFLSRSSVVILE